MQIVIDIDKKVSIKICEIYATGDDIPIGIQAKMLKAIVDGTVLPEHGRLIDADKVKNKLQEHHDFYLSAYDNDFKSMPIQDKARCDEIIESIAEIINAPTILEGTVKE